MSGEPLILYENICETSGATISATDTASGYSTNSLKNRLPWDRWRSNGSATETVTVQVSTPVACTCLVVSGHNLSTQTAALNVVEKSPDGAVWTAVGGVSGTISNDQTYFYHWGASGSGYTTDAQPYWRATFSGCDSNIEIGVLAFGRVLVLPEYMGQGFDPDNVSLKMRDARARGGNYLGASVEMAEQTMKIDFGPAGLAASFFTTTGTPSWIDFLKTAWSNGKPFFFAPAGGYNATIASFGNAYFCTAGNRPKSSAPYLTSLRRDWKFQADVIPEGYMG